MNGEMFVAYVEQFLAPTLSPGDVVVMDDVPGYKVAGMGEAIERIGATCLLTFLTSIQSNSYSPSSCHCIDPPQPAPLMRCGRRSASSASSSDLPNAATTSVTAAM